MAITSSAPIHLITMVTEVGNIGKRDAEMEMVMTECILGIDSAFPSSISLCYFSRSGKHTRHHLITLSSPLFYSSFLLPHRSSEHSED